MSGTDQRIAYGANCTWWGPIGDVATKPSGLPCCPHCGGVLLEAEDMESWMDAARRIGRQHDIDYEAAIKWCRDRCNRVPGVHRDTVHLDTLPTGPEPPIYRWWLRDGEVAA